MTRHAVHHVIREILRTLFTRPTTVEMPSDEELQLFHKNFRGRLEADSDLCVGCGICVRICPAQALELERSQDENGSAYDLIHTYSRCAYCGLCEDACPHQAIHFTNAFVRAVTDKKDARIILTSGVYKPKGKPTK